MRERPVLPPAGHATVGEFWVCGKQFIGTQSEILDDAWPESFDETVGRGNQFSYGLNGGRILEVTSQRPAVTRQRVQRRLLGGTRALHANHVGAHVGEHHAGERRRAESGQLNNSHSI